MKDSWPAWYYGPNGASAVFNTAGEVPKGWEDHPSKVGNAAAQAPAAQAPATQAPAAQATSAEQIDAHGHPWSAELHASTKTLTKEGLWRMKVGVSRPAPLPGFPKKFDL